EVERIEQRLPTGGGDRVVQAVELRNLAPEQHHGGAFAGAGLGGLGTEAAVGPGDQHHPPGERAAHACSSSASIRASSPDSNNSRVMSQPPINSPLMNSCGKVGQLE